MRRRYIATKWTGWCCSGPKFLSLDVCSYHRIVHSDLQFFSGCATTPSAAFSPVNTPSSSTLLDRGMRFPECHHCFFFCCGVGCVSLSSMTSRCWHSYGSCASTLSFARGAGYVSLSSVSHIYLSKLSPSNARCSFSMIFFAFAGGLFFAYATIRVLARRENCLVEMRWYCVWDIIHVDGLWICEIGCLPCV